MRLQRNIGARGRRYRALSGLLFLIAAALLVFGFSGSAGWRWGAAAPFALVGAFQLFEAAAGWCILRACGIRTPL